ncbi:MAG: hypothetical protein ACREX9_07700 [Gammaproteobacteria bacterium]
MNDFNLPRLRRLEYFIVGGLDLRLVRNRNAKTASWRAGNC